MKMASVDVIWLPIEQYADATSQMHHWEAKTTTPQRNKRMYWLHKLIDFMLPSDSELIITRTTRSRFVYSTLSPRNPPLGV